MKLLLQNPFAPFRKKIIIKSLIGLILFFNLATKSFSQCAVGYTRDTINWDYLDFLHRAGVSVYGTVLPPPASYVPVTLAMAQTQYFNVSGNRVTFTNTNSMPIGGAAQIWGDVTTHTGEAGSFGVGEDVKFMPAITPATYSMTFSFHHHHHQHHQEMTHHHYQYDERITNY